ncbi:MAG TPA: argininosuccinate lyase [Xanthomonadaceae bacterium]|nr:argininosuccinate lyase [Xanthomonadaceae bacterium]
MTEPVWSKPGFEIDERIQRFLAGEDVILDRELFAHDIEASRVHAQGLARIGIVSEQELAALSHELDELAADFASGAFVLDERYEDGHSAIEARLTERLGDTGRRIHTGRSRNDQVLVALRLWMRAALTQLQQHCAAIAGVALERAGTEPMLPLPGYTHLQRAMVSSTGMWWAAWAEGFIDDAAWTVATLAAVDANPLGSASGYGVNLPLDRDAGTQALGFARLQVNPIQAQLSRGKFELQALAVLSSALLDLRRLAWDLSLFTTAEFGFVELPAAYTTGSSLMPNKRNPDLVELLRGSYAVAAGARAEIESLLSLPSGYHRDLQYAKAPLLRAFGHGLSALALVPGLLAALSWNRQRMRDACEAGMYATDKAIELARAGVPFREAYRRAAAEPLPAAGADPDASLAARVSPGGAADLRLDVLRARLQAL